jgi:hypothetical protein
MNVQRAEQAREALVILRRQDLVAEHEHMVGVESLANFLQLLRRDRFRQIDTADLGADDGRQWIDRDGARIASFFVGFGSGRHVFSVLQWSETLRPQR